MILIRQQLRPFTVGKLFCLVLLLSGGVNAEEPIGEFLEGLYRRGDVDTARMYLDHLETDNQLSSEVRQQIPCHRAILLMLEASRTVRRDTQLRQYQQAHSLLQQFLRDHPDHALASQAKELSSKVQLQLAQRRISEEEIKPADAEQAASMRSMRDQIAELRSMFLQQQEYYQQKHDKYPAYISQDEPVLREARERVLDQLIRSRLDLAQCDYWEAHTYPVDHEERLRLLTAAGSAYELIHQRYRSQLGGLYARLWQGKCYEELRSEQGIRLALGIYGELIGHDGMSPSLTALRDRALLYRLTCLNSPFRQDDQLVEMEAKAWLDSADSRTDAEVGLGIQWELCRALEHLGQDKRWPSETRLDSLRQAKERIDRLLRLTGEQTREFIEFQSRIEAALAIVAPPAGKN